MRTLICAVVLFASLTIAHATMVASPWMPIFKGIDHIVGTNYADATIPRQQVVHCVRIDLTDPDVQLFPTPPASNPQAEFRETLDLSVPHFLQANGLQIASDANFYTVNPGGSDPSSEGLPSEVHGLLICTGIVV